MSDLNRGAWTWDRVWIGCGKSKRDGMCPAGEMYTGPVFAAHRSIVDHLGFPEPEIMSAEHGVIAWTAEIKPYNTTLDLAEDRHRFSGWVMREVEALVEEVARTRRNIGVTPAATIDGRWPPRRCRDHGVDGDRLWCGCAWPCRERHSFAFGPPQQPSILVLAGAPYLDGWIEQARALGVRVDDPLRGYSLGDRRMIARRFCAETPRWTNDVGVEWSHGGEHVEPAQLDLWSAAQ